MYRIFICDDNRGELEKITGIITEYTFENKIPAEIKSFSSGEKLLEYEETNSPADIYILDIIMPDMNGVQLGKAVRQKNPGAFIIFLTTSEDYALESYSVKAFAYIIKPAKNESIISELADCFSRISKPPERFVIKYASGMTTVTADEIIFIEYYDHQMYYHLSDGKKIESIYFREPFDSVITDYLKSGSFVKTSASYLVNMAHIKSVTAYGFILSDGTELAVTRKYAEARKKYIDYELNGGVLL